jgi:hypothetical protein
VLPPIKKPGKPPLISKNVKCNLIKSIESYTSRTSDTLTLWQKNILKPLDSSIETLLSIERDREAASHGVNRFRLPVLKNNTFYRTANCVAPLEISHATQRNERRAEALRDMYAAISMAVVGHAILCPVLILPMMID